MLKDEIINKAKKELVESYFEKDVQQGKIRPDQLSNPSILERKKREILEKIEKYQKELEMGINLLVDLDEDNIIIPMLEKLEKEAQILSEQESAEDLDDYDFPEDLLTLEECKKIYELGFNAYQDSHFKESLLIFKVMTTYFPHNPFAWMGVIQASHSLQDPDHIALDYCDQTAEIFADEPNALVFCSEYYYQAQQFLKAKDCADKALELLEQDDSDPELLERAKSVSVHANK
jgi:hypothetical protein